MPIDKHCLQKAFVAEVTCVEIPENGDFFLFAVSALILPSLLLAILLNFAARFLPQGLGLGCRQRRLGRGPAGSA